MWLSYVGGQQRIGDNKKCRRIAGDFDCHADAAVRWRVHRPMKHNQGFTQSQWMPPSGEYSHRIATAATMVDVFGRKHKTLTKTIFS
jgi:hypothetical protein